MKTIIVAAAASIVATSALAQSATEKAGINSLFGVAPKTEDFVKEASMSDVFEIASSQLAIERADGATKGFAEQMVQDHQRTTSELKQIVVADKVNATPADTMSKDQQDALSDLQTLQGDKFIKRYQEDQVDAHEHAVDLFMRYAKGGDNPSLKAWASKTLPTLQHHLDMVQNLQ
ncbi:putative membrane protein [Mycoplana sp. BE70]|uniref:DUF4142 domain-containing protein n=1 Tax=Mycoplana sp. BE70 TaxID=2817775 RepID=UPI002854AF19|nr:DUF4142 domain-containing protein [Mycoplana sp. BE70]MDR6758115.1 putative membrane protein [Mycoplana sp. BE70]